MIVTKLYLPVVFVVSQKIYKDLAAKPLLIGVFIGNKNIIDHSHPSRRRLELLDRARRALNTTLFFFSPDETDEQKAKYLKLKRYWLKKKSSLIPH